MLSIVIHTQSLYKITTNKVFTERTLGFAHVLQILSTCQIADREWFTNAPRASCHTPISYSLDLPTLRGSKGNPMSHKTTQTSPCLYCSNCPSHDFLFTMRASLASKQNIMMILAGHLCSSFNAIRLHHFIQTKIIDAVDNPQKMDGELHSMAKTIGGKNNIYSDFAEI